ncbi:MAG: PDZ domain-containing protein [Candidatus Brocadiales bacterium]
MSGTVAPVWGASLFSGLVLSQGEQEGVRIVEVYPGSPSEKAGIKVADLIVGLGGQKIKVLNDFVVKSRSIDKEVPEITVSVLRKGELLDLVIASYSMPVYQSWKVKVVQPPYTALHGVSLFQYWVEKGKRKLLENQGNIPVDRKLANCRDAIKLFFFALHYSPTAVDAGLMVADTYRTMAGLYQAAGAMPEALRSYAKAAEFYNMSSDKTTKEDDLQKILANLQDVEERLYKLLPQEQSGQHPTAHGPDVTKDEL